MDTPLVSVVWYVVGDNTYSLGAIKPELFATKGGAERWAKELFPNETPDQQYARVMFRTVEDVR